LGFTAKIKANAFMSDECKQFRSYQIINKDIRYTD
jgi:hypothetical protein